MGLYTNEYKCKDRRPWSVPVSFQSLRFMGESFIGHRNHFGRIITNCIKVWQSKHIKWLLARTCWKYELKWSKAETWGLFWDSEYWHYIWTQKFAMASLGWLCEALLTLFLARVVIWWVRSFCFIFQQVYVFVFLTRFHYCFSTLKALLSSPQLGLLGSDMENDFYLHFRIEPFKWSRKAGFVFSRTRNLIESWAATGMRKGWTWQSKTSTT